jgi:hypothetical protein
MNTTQSEDGALREKLAAIEHERWADWQKWCNQTIRMNLKTGNIEGVLLALNRWDKQIETPYAELSEAEKASDMEQVDRYWPLIQQYVADACNQARLEEMDNLVRHGKVTGASFVGLHAYLNQRKEELASLIGGKS